MFYITDENDYGRREIVDTFETIEEAQAVIDLLEAHLDDGPSYRLRCAIAELKEQLADYLLSV